MYMYMYTSAVYRCHMQHAWLAGVCLSESDVVLVNRAHLRMHLITLYYLCVVYSFPSPSSLSLSLLPTAFPSSLSPPYHFPSSLSLLPTTFPSSLSPPYHSPILSLSSLPLPHPLSLLPTTSPSSLLPPPSHNSPSSFPPDTGAHTHTATHSPCRCLQSPHVPVPPHLSTLSPRWIAQETHLTPKDH